jgi:hypothetical protein
VTIKVKYHLDTGFVGCTHEEVCDVSVPDDATENEIERELEEYGVDWIFNHIEWGWDLVQEGEQVA